MAALTAGNQIEIPQVGHVVSSPDWRLSLLKRLGGSQKEPLVVHLFLKPASNLLTSFRFPDMISIGFGYLL